MDRLEQGFLDALFEAPRIGLGLVDTELRYVRVNEALASMNGLPAEEHVGRTVREVIPALADLAEDLLRGVMYSGRPMIDLELSGPTPDDPDAERNYLVSYYPIRDGDSLVGVGCLVVEETDSVRARRELMDQSRDIYENVVQDLTVAHLALEQGELETTAAHMQKALKAAKHIISKVLLEEWSL